MKTSILYISLALASATSAQEACVEGKRVTISPGYTVEYKCNRFHAGQSYDNVMSHEDCAAKCQVANLDICTYHAVKKKCVVGDPNRKDGPSPGATYMVRVPEEPEDPFPEEEEDPFKETCEEQKDSLRGELDQCRADLEAASNKPPSCGIPQFATPSYSYTPNMDFASCKNACNADPRCLSYGTHLDRRFGVPGCHIYDKESADLSLRPVPYWTQTDKRCN